MINGSPDPVRLIEGGPSHVFQFKLTLPNVCFCDQSKKPIGCRVVINTHIPELAPDTIPCVNNLKNTIPQVVVQSPLTRNIYSFCNITLNSNNWDQLLNVTIIPTLDGITDGDVNLTVYFNSHIKWYSTPIYSKPITSVKVSTYMITQFVWLKDHFWFRLKLICQRSVIILYLELFWNVHWK